jgi:hypothetical protein
MKRKLLLLFFTATLSACTALPQPFAIPDGRYYRRVPLNRFPVVVTKIDGVSNSRTAPLIEPGQHTLTLISLGPHLGYIPQYAALHALHTRGAAPQCAARTLYADGG